MLNNHLLDQVEKLRPEHFIFRCMRRCLKPSTIWSTSAAWTGIVTATTPVLLPVFHSFAVKVALPPLQDYEVFPMLITTGRVAQDPGERGLTFEADDGQTHRTMNIGFITLERQSNRSINGTEEAIGVPTAKALLLLPSLICWGST